MNGENTTPAANHAEKGSKQEQGLAAILHPLMEEKIAQVWEQRLRVLLVTCINAQVILHEKE